MRNIQLVRGFTFIELLLVIAIAGFVGSLIIILPGAGQRSARDERRVADLRQVEQSLRLFFLKCGFYPGSYDSSKGGCVGGLLSGNQAAENPNNWSDFQKALVDAGVGVVKVPNDPASGATYEYRVELGSGVSRAQCYWLKATFENPNHQALSDPKELDGVIDTSSIPNLYPTTQLDCDGSAYCLGNIECTYDG